MTERDEAKILLSFYDLSGQSGIPFRKDLFEEIKNDKRFLFKQGNRNGEVQES
jgi:hypothetical protein